MNTIQVLDKTFEPFIPQEKIENAIADVAKRVSRDYKDKKPLFLVMLNGAFMFAAEFFKHMEDPCEIQFVKYTTYNGTSSTNKVNHLIGLPEGLEGRDVVIVEDIVDSGFSMKCLTDDIALQKPKSCKIVTMLFKPKAFKYDYKIDYVGLEIGNEFIVGYGLDYNSFGRNLPAIYKIVEK